MPILRNSANLTYFSRIHILREYYSHNEGLTNFIYKICLTSKMNEIIELGTISSKGQVCIPSDIREELGLTDGSKILFCLQNEALVIKKVDSMTFAQITKPLKELAKKTRLKESQVNNIVHKARSGL